MSLFDEFFISVFSHYKNTFKKKANSLALIYITLLQISLILLLGVFFAAFLKQMNVETMSSSNAWTLFVLTSLIILFKNWIQFSGRKRGILNARFNKKKSKHYNIWILWLLPICSIALSVILLQVF